MSAANLPTYFAGAARSGEVTGADWTGGMNRGGSCAPGIGINTGAIDPKLEDWSVLDQAEAARDPQNSQNIGGTPAAITAVQGADVNDTLTYIVALAQAAPGVGFGAGNGDPINRTGQTIEIGDRAWGTNTVA